MPDKKKDRIAIIINADGRTIANSATFIRSHIRSISEEFDVITFVGNPNSRRILEKNTDFQKQGWLYRATRKIVRIVKGKTVIEQDNRSLGRYLKKYKVKAVFAEYGISGADVLDCCKQINIPLIVHFHGYDAYRHDLLARYHDQYMRMFKYASCIIAVSKDMCKQLGGKYENYSKIVHNSCGVNLHTITHATQGVNKKKTVCVSRSANSKKRPCWSYQMLFKGSENLAKL